MTNGFALNHDKSLQIYFFCVKCQAKNDFLKDVESTVSIGTPYMITLHPLYNMVRYNTGLDITRFKDRSQNVQIILKNDHKWSFFNIIYTFFLDITRLFN